MPMRSSSSVSTRNSTISPVRSFTTTQPVSQPRRQRTPVPRHGSAPMGQSPQLLPRRVDVELRGQGACQALSMSSPPLRVRPVDLGGGRDDVDKLVRTAFRGGTCTEATQPACVFGMPTGCQVGRPAPPNAAGETAWRSVLAFWPETDADRQRESAAMCASRVVTRDDASLMSPPDSASPHTG